MQNESTQLNFIPSLSTYWKEKMKGTEKISEVEPGLLYTRDQCTFLVLRCMYIFIMDFGDFL